MTEVLNNTSNNNFVTPPSSPPKLGTTYSIFEEPFDEKLYSIWGVSAPVEEATNYMYI